MSETIESTNVLADLDIEVVTERPTSPTTPKGWVEFWDVACERTTKALADVASEVETAKLAKGAADVGSPEEATAKEAYERVKLRREKLRADLKTAQAKRKKAVADLAKHEARKQRNDEISNPYKKDGITILVGEKSWADVRRRWETEPLQCVALVERDRIIGHKKVVTEERFDRATSREEWERCVETARSKKGPLWRVTSERNEQPVPDLDQIENMLSILDNLGIETYWSDMRHEQVFRRGGTVLDLDPVLAEVRQCARTWGRGETISKETVCEQLLLLALKDRRHEMRDWVFSAPEYVPSGNADSPIERHFKTHVLADGADEDLCRAMHRIWCLQVGAALMHPRGQYRGVLVYVGGEYEGKSRALQSLALPGCVQTGQSFDPADEDSVHRALRHTIAEMSEVDATFRKADGSRLKAFLGRDEDQFHLRYDRGQTTWFRRTVFAASVNPDEQGKFLSATAGDTRWWVLPIKTFKPDPTLDMRMVWREAIAEVEVRQREGLPGWWPDRDLMQRIVAANSAYKHVDPIREAVSELYEADDSGRVPTADVRASVVAHLDVPWGLKEVTKLKAALRALCGEPKVVKGQDRWTIRPKGTLRVVSQAPEADVLSAFDQ